MSPCRAMLAHQMLGELAKDFHILRVATDNVWLEHLEHTTLATPGGGVLPGEAHHRTDAGLGKDGQRKFDRVGFELGFQFPLDDGLNLFGSYIGDTVFELDERAA